jgi:hypothetical protein
VAHGGESRGGKSRFPQGMPGQVDQGRSPPGSEAEIDGQIVVLLAELFGHLQQESTK